MVGGRPQAPGFKVRVAVLGSPVVRGGTLPVLSHGFLAERSSPRQEILQGFRGAGSQPGLCGNRIHGDTPVQSGRGRRLPELVILVSEQLTCKNNISRNVKASLSGGLQMHIHQACLAQSNGTRTTVSHFILFLNMIMVIVIIFDIYIYNQT